MRNFFRFLYLNIYAFFLMIGGLAIFAIPLYRFSLWWLVPQFFFSLLFFKPAIKLFATWEDKKLKLKILYGKNKTNFRPDTFAQFMKAPCGRLITKAVLKDLGKSEEYKNLLRYKDPFFVSMKENCKSQETKIYINEEFLSKMNSK